MKRIFTIFLSLLALTSFGQINIRTGDPRTLIHPSHGVLLNASTGASTLDTMTSVIEASWYGATGNGVTDDWAALALCLSVNKTAHWIHLPRGNYVISAPLPVTLYGSRFYADDSATTISCASGTVIALGDFIHSSIENMKLIDTRVNATQDFLHGTIYSEGHHTWDSKIINVDISAPNDNVGGINFLTQNLTFGGSINRLTIQGVKVHDCGGSGIGIGNRNYAPGAADSCKDVWITDSYIYNLGSGGNNGIGVTWDGNGNGGGILRTTFKNCYDICVENTGYNNMEFGWLTFKYTGSGNPLYGFSYSNRLSTGNWIHDIKSDSLPNGNVFWHTAGLTIERSTMLSNGGFAAAIIRNCVGLVSSHNHYGTSNGIGLVIQSHLADTGTINQPCLNNFFSYDSVDNRTASSNTALIQFQGPFANNNQLDHIKMGKASGGVYVQDTSIGAHGNWVSNASLLSDTTNLSFHVTAISMSDANYTFTQDQDGIMSQYYVFTGTLTAARTVTFSNRNHSGMTILNGTNQTITPTYSITSSSVSIPAGQTATIYNDGTTLRSSLPTSTTGTGAAVYGTSPTIATPALSGAVTGTFTLPVTTALATSPSIANNTTIATGSNVFTYVASIVASAKIKPTVASVTGPITSITADSMVWGKCANAVTLAGHFTCTPPASGSCTASILMPGASGLVGGHALFGTATWSNGTTNGSSTSVVGVGLAGTTAAQITWPSGGATATEVYYTLTYYLQ